MGVTWTEEQQKVIDLRDRNILVSAAAGSGKTAVLVERIITMLTDVQHPIDVDRLLIVTFTEAAAAEMKERIRNAIEKQLEEHPEDEHLMQQATLIHSAQITTIHSFCLSVIRDHFHAIDLDPGFRIGEEGELKLLKHDVLSELLEDRYLEGEERFLEFVSAYGSGKTDQKIEDLILKIYEYSRSYPEAEVWLDDCIASYRAETAQELENSDYVALIRENVRRYVTDANRLIEQGLAICAEPDGPAAYEATLQKDAQMIEPFERAQTFAQMQETASKLSWVRLASNRDKTVSEEKVQRVKAIREEVKELIGDLISQYFLQDIEGVLEDIRMCRPAMEELASLVKEFSDRFEAKKRSQNMIDFSDMEQYALRILTEKKDGKLIPSSVAKEYQQQFLEIMIDEYQDSNLIQETILTSISTVSEGRYNIFMVGDVKQSIYRFRLSRPELFMEKFDTYQTEDSQTQRIDLYKNFRSRGEVLDAVNSIFRQIMTRDLGGIAYDDKAALYVGASYPEMTPEEEAERGLHMDMRTEVLVIDGDIQTDDGENSDKQKTIKISERELEAKAIAVRIRELLAKHQVVDKKEGIFRPVRYSDIVILTRSVRGFADVFTEVLNKEGIPTYSSTREGYFAAQEIGVILDYLRVLNNRRQDIPLAAVLASPIGGLLDEELAILKSTYPEYPFWKAVSLYAGNAGKESAEDPEKVLTGNAEKESAEDPEKVLAGNTEKESAEDLMIDSVEMQKEIICKLQHFFGQLDRFQEIVPYTPMHELLWEILEETGYRDYVSAMPGGEQRTANLEMLVEKARAFESTSYKGLFHFVQYIEQLRKYDVDYGEANVEDEQSDTVRVMTIHKSKGLEFPIVFVAGMGKRFNMQDARSSVVLHARMGVGLDAVDTTRRMKSPSIVKKVIQKEEALDSLAEELRVLYVALTRAKEKLIITGTMTGVEKKMELYRMMSESGKETLSYGWLSKASTYWDWILPAVLRAGEREPLTMQVQTAENILGAGLEERMTDAVSKQIFEEWDAEKVYDPQMQEMLKEQFGYQYAYPFSRNQKLKFTVSELKKRIYLQENLGEELEEAGEMLYEEPEVLPLLPKFLQENEELTGASRGTAYHRLLELLDYANISENTSENTGGNTAENTPENASRSVYVYDMAQLESDIQRFVKEGRLREDMAACIRRGDILKFLNSPVGQRVCQAARQSKLWKEQPFVLGVDARSIYPQELEGELILVQGIIDVYFEEADGLVVLDYKTDKVSSAKELVERYHAQLDYYAKALEQMKGKKVKEKIIYSITLGEEIKL
jgi:ATP-dependent helicase/nuclease subunit A